MDQNFSGFYIPADRPMAVIILFRDGAKILGEPNGAKRRFQKHTWRAAVEGKNAICCTEPSYQNESSDSVSRKPLDGFKNAFNTKYISLFDGRFITTILLSSKI